ncbi:hypothetical protein [Enhygromyxa salina]|uniref:Uncharacterized protein n=1 Tax=Enhygromyxa salina TaxID=215803 RepID=A0A2S9YPD2_9BACT|nr:hypothetical protein [Enhygromyxa salina]PRQ06944.1 hypothetical protein ENSA7_33680 [Enhygromyxa salina]
MQALLLALARDPRARRRRVAVGTLLVTFAGALSFAALRPRVAPSEPEVCANTGDQMTQTWDEARAARVEQTVRSRHGEQANEILAMVVPQIHRYANEWADMRDEACRTHAEGQQSENVFDLRTACLDKRLASLDTLVQILVNADAQQLQEVGRAAAGLPAIDSCADTAALLAAIAPPRPASSRSAPKKMSRS